MTLPERSPLSSPDHDSGQDELLSLFLAYDTPPGYHAELVNQEIIVTPPPRGEHEGIIGRIIRAINRNAEMDLLLVGNRGLITPRGRFIPAITAASEESFTLSDSWAPPTGVELVCEVTSHRPDTDRDHKRLGYAESEIPLYLLIDRERQVSVLFSEPADGDYQAINTLKFGHDLRLPPPFDLAIDTADFH